MALIGQTERLAPADKKLYALRDVTGTVECIPLISASILSKKLAEGIDALVLDVKVGSGAFMKTIERARELSRTLVELGRSAGKRVTALLTDMDQPLGRWVGNAVEVREALDVLAGNGEPDLLELTLALGAEMLLLGDAVKTIAEGRGRIQGVLKDGSALERFRSCVELQGGQLAGLGDRVESARQAVDAKQDGFVHAIDAEQVGLAAMELGAGRTRKEDAIDPSMWIWLSKKVGEQVRAGEPLAAFSPPRRAGREAICADVERRLAGAFTLAREPPPPRPLILEVMR